MPKQKPKQHHHTKPSIFPYLLIVLGILLLSVWTAHRMFYARSMSLPDSLTNAFSAQEPQARAPIPTHIRIGTLVNVDVHPAVFANNTWSVSPTAANVVAVASRPGEAGNIILYGHNKRSVLGNLRTIKGGETVVITTADGADHFYRVTQIHEVDPSTTEFLAPTTEEVLTIYTCSGFMDSKRFIVRAKPIRAI